tara:strand:+ start:270 stop:710 length:441 start_codon:yes stop_codon:yes gene_type:complete
MAHFAKIGMSSKVISVLRLNDKDMLDANGVEDEKVGQQYLEKHNNWPAQMWIQTSYNTHCGKHKSADDSKALRGNYAGIGMTWDEDNQIFWPKKPYDSWVKNTTDAQWHSPIGDAPALPEVTLETQATASYYEWNEVGQSWDLKTP